MDNPSAIRLNVSSSLIAWELSRGTLYTIDGVAKAASLSRGSLLSTPEKGCFSPSLSPERVDTEAIHMLREIEKLRVIRGFDSSGVRLVFGLFKEIGRLRREMDYPIEF